MYNFVTFVTGYLNSDEDYNIQAIAKIQHIFKLCMDEGRIFLLLRNRTNVFSFK